ncbi:MAG: L-histidine N(alpha)-methyltransferase, partial [Chloroflexota bacterium]|nr:L-histidine N(alpha)-methyltransferase [Chloroflexota bacterium]
TPARYVAFDVSESIVREAGEDLVRSYSGLEVHGVIGDFERHLGTIPAAQGRRLVLFLGGTIGNLEREERQAFLCQVRELLSRGDFLLLGTDLVKDVDVLEAAYNDSAGVSANFSRNVLSVINYALHADFDLSLWRHRAHWNADAARIEMHLYARRAHSVRIADLDMTVDFAEGESIWTENSHKFTRETASAMLEGAGMTLDTWYTDALGYFGLALARAA